MNENLLTVREAADYLKCSETSIFNLLKKGMPSIKVPGLGRRILKAECYQWFISGGANRPAKSRVKLLRDNCRDAK
jgi:excisionase family DNA binding protein